MHQPKYLTGITPLRGIAALLVVFLHFNTFFARLIPDGRTHLVDKLYLMVDLFFVLSGFIMYHVYGKLFTSSINGADYLNFMKARFARIYPLHLFSFLFLVALSLIFLFTRTPEGNFLQSSFDRSAILSQLLLTHAMGTHPEATWNIPSWSISVEWWTYLIFPFIMLALVRTRIWSRYLLVVLIVWSYIIISYYIQPVYWAKRWERMHIPSQVPFPMYNLDVITGIFAFLRCLCGFFCGMMVYEGYRKSWAKNWTSSGMVFTGLWIAMLALLHLDVVPDFLMVAIFALMILSASYNTGKVSGVLNSKGFQYLGDISYSIYLTHIPLLFSFITYRKIFVPNDPREQMLGYKFTLVEAWTIFSVFLITLFILATLTYQYIEKPARYYLNRSKRPIIHGA